MEHVIPLPWKDDFGAGLGGTLELRPSDLPQGACVADLIAVLNKRIPQPSADKVYRDIKHIKLYGSRLGSHRLLAAIVPAINSTCPRLIATSRVCSHGSYDVVVKTLTGYNLLVNCERGDSLSALKQRIRDSEGIAEFEQRIIFNGRQLEDDGKLLVDHGIIHKSEVHLVGRLRGGGGGPRIFADVSNGSLLIEREFSASAPSWRVCGGGMNVEGRCENRECLAFRRMVIQPNGYHAFNLFYDKMHCPECRASVKPVTCGFYDCVWKFEGVRSSDQCMMSSQWKTAFGEKYHRFDADSTHGTVEWDSLLIVVKTPVDAKSFKLAATQAQPSAVEDEQHEDCVLCWSSLNDWDCPAVPAPPCAHRFHENCVKEWTRWCARNESLPTCPVCRTVTIKTEAERG